MSLKDQKGLLGSVLGKQWGRDIQVPALGELLVEQRDSHSMRPAEGWGIRVLWELWGEPPLQPWVPNLPPSTGPLGSGLQALLRFFSPWKSPSSISWVHLGLSRFLEKPIV